MIQLIVGFMAFHSAISKTKSTMAFKMIFLLSPLINFQFQMLLGRGNVSRKQSNRMTLEFLSLNSSISLGNPRVSSVLRRTVIFKEKFGVTVGSNGPSRSMVPMKRRLIESLRLSRDHPTLMEASDASTSLRSIRWIFIQRSRFNQRSIGHFRSRPL